MDENLIKGTEYLLEERMNWTRLTLFALYENCIELDEEICNSGWERIGITGMEILLQCNLKFEYDVQYDYVSKKYMQDLKDRQEREKYVQSIPSFISNPK